MRQRIPTSRRTNPPPHSAVGVLVERLDQLARERGPGNKLPTVQEICGSYGVSVTTVQEALHTLEARNVLYRRQGSGIFVSPHLNRKCIRVLLNGTLAAGAGVSPFWGMLWGRCIEEAQRRAETRLEALDFHLVSQNARQDAEYFAALESDVLTGRVHGILSIGLDETVPQWMRKPDTPHVAYAGEGPHRIVSGDDSRIRVGVGALAAQGCRHIAYWNHIVATTSGELAHRERIAFEETIRALGLPEVEDALPHLAEEMDSPDWRRLTIQEQGYRLAHRIFSGRRSPIDGVFIGDDMMTSGAIVAFTEMGIVIGRDLRVATGSNAGSPILFGFENCLTRIEVDPGAIARALFDVLDDILTGRRAEPSDAVLAATIRLPEDALSPLRDRP